MSFTRVVVIGDRSWQSAVAEHLAQASTPTRRIDLSDATGPGMSPDVVVGVCEPAPAGLRSSFASTDADAFALHCEQAVWRSAELLRESWVRLGGRQGRAVIVEVVGQSADVSYAIDVTVTAARKALIASLAARWQASGIAALLVTIRTAPGTREPAAAISVAGGELLRWVACGESASQSGRCFSE